MFSRSKLIFLLFLSSHLLAKINVVTSTTDLASITQEIGGDNVSVTSIARGNQDPHFVEILPSFMLKTKRADLYIKVGMELDLWAEGIIRGSRNRDLRVLDCSTPIQALEIPVGEVNASMGDIHQYGNPHYWLDPLNGILMAEYIANELIAMDPDHQQTYLENFNRFEKSITKKVDQWLESYGHLSGKKVLFYHNTWPYFNFRFNIETAGFVEPVPGIMPTPSHIDYLVHLIQDRQLKVIAIEPYFSDTAPQYLSKKTGIKTITLAPSTGALPEVQTYLDLFDYNLKQLSEALNTP